MSPAGKLRELLSKRQFQLMPCCFDPMSVRLVEQAGFSLTFMSGFGVSATRLGMPDTGMISYAEMVDQGRNICQVVDIPVIGDGDTGYGNAMNVKRTVDGYAAAGFTAIMIEDQVAPKRCSHTRGKSVVERDEAFTRIQAAVDARDSGPEILILARTDARQVHGLDEALTRARTFTEIGADLLLVEGPRNREEMRRVCRELPGPIVANMIEGGDTPMVPATELGQMGFAVAAYPLTRLSASIRAMQESLREMANGKHPDDRLLEFAALRRVVGFDAYMDEEGKYAKGKPGGPENDGSG